MRHDVVIDIYEMLGHLMQGLHKACSTLGNKEDECKKQQRPNVLYILCRIKASCNTYDELSTEPADVRETSHAGQAAPHVPPPDGRR